MAANCRPLDTAPRDGTRILLWCGPNRGWQIGTWNPDRHAKNPKPFWNWSPFRVSDSRAFPALGWLPLPADPVLAPPAIPGLA
jgi:hypothetical protein